MKILLGYIDMKYSIFQNFIFYLCLLLYPLNAFAWQELESGLAFGEFHAPNPSAYGDSVFTVLKIDPKYFSFHLLMASQFGKAQTLEDWAKKHDLLASINASMYLPDHTRSTGFMRCGAHVNNSRINARFGAFFVAGPKHPDLPLAQIMERKFHDWQNLLKEYSCVVQNYRMISQNGKNLWKQNSHSFSMSCVAMDKQGNILFIHCRSPFSVHDFSENLLALPLNIKNAMYTEGGRESGLYIRSRLMTKYWSGRYSSMFFKSAASELLPLPNVLGIRRRE